MTAVTPSATLLSKLQGKTARVFKTAWFARAAKKARIKDDELCQAIREVQKGQCDDLGGGILKKRLKNMHRSIVLSKAELLWVYAYLYAKKDRANIDDRELEGFRKIAKAYGALSEKQLSKLLDDKDLTEICNGDETAI